MRTKRKVLSLILAALMSFSAVPAVSAADTQESIENYVPIYDTYTQDSESLEWSMIPSDDMEAPSLFSMMPLEEINLYLDLDGYLPAELEEFQVSDLLEMAKESYSYYSEALDRVYAWSDLDVSSGDYHLVTDESVIDLTATSYWNEWSNYSRRIQLISGEQDILDSENQRYILRVYVNYNSDSILLPDVVSSTREELNVTGASMGSSSGYQDGERYAYGQLYTWIYEKDWPEDNKGYVGINFSETFKNSGLSVRLYDGFYLSEEEIPADAADLTETLLDQGDLSEEGHGRLMSLNHQTSLTAVFSRNGETVDVLPLRMWFSEDGKNLSFNDLCAEIIGNRRSVSSSWSYSYDDYETLNMTLSSGYKADDTYYLGLYFYDPDSSADNSNYGINNVEKAVVGYYTSADEIRSDECEDIKAQLFSDAYTSGGGYPANYSEGVVFSVLDMAGDIQHFALKTEEYPVIEEILPSAPRPLSADTYFRAEGAYVREDGSRKLLSSYIMPYEADAYYYNGYQTVFLMDEDENGNYIPLSEGSIIYPNFYTGSKVHMYASHDATAGDLQTSGGSESTFQSGEVTQYSAAAENGTHLKNYWVTYLTQQTDEESPKLFINGANDKERYITVNGEEMYQRELFLIDDFGDYHDIFFANLGDKPLEGMYVRLEDPVNIALDEYWTISDGSSLGAFTTTEKRDKDGDYVSYGELQNVGKVRLRADLDEEGNAIYGAVSGTLVIGYNGSSSEDGTEEGAGEEYRILLSGIAANPKVTTATLADAVKYVPYSQLIMTNNMYDNDKVKFEIVSGRLPDGIELRPNGEIYGLPTKVGTYTFEVEVTFTSEVYGITITDTLEYTINVLDNTDTNVFWTNETDNQGYEFVEDDETGLVGTQVADHEILYHVWVDDTSYVMVDGEEIYESYEWELFWSEGPHDAEFMYFFLDGEELVRGVDYTSEEGSTKINIQSQTFRNAGEGHHTIAAEFRTGKTDDGIMKRTSQNVYVHNVTADTPSVPETPSTPSTPDSSYFNDILSDIQDFVREQMKETEKEQEEEPIESDSVSSNNQHSITFVQNEGGTVESSYLQAMEGTLVTITVSPFDGFLLKTIEASSETEVYLTKISDTEYTFTMPGDPVEIRTSFEPVETDFPEELPFLDVPKSEWFFDSIAYVHSRGLMNGTGSASFAPHATTSRAMIVTVLYRMAGEPEVSGGASFDDVAADSYCTNAVAWAAETGIVEGYDGQHFGTDDPVTREQVAAILYRYAVHVGRDTSAANMLINFLDADQISAYAVPAMEWANAEGLILGMTENTLNPSGEATRAQIAAILARFRRGE